MASEGHRVVNRYHMEDRIGLVRAPTLVMGATEDPHAFPAMWPVARGIASSRVVEVAGGTVPLPDHKPKEFSEAILRFLQDEGLIL